MIPLTDRLSLKLIISIGCALLLALLIHDRNRWKSRTSHYAALLSAERAAHDATVSNYRAAAEQARRQDAANAARVRSAQAAINERSDDAYETRIAAVRAAAGSLRQRPSADAGPGRGGSAPVPGLPAAAEGAAEAAGQDRLSGSDRLTATEQAIQLDELIKWVRQQAAVEPGAADGRGD